MRLACSLVFAGAAGLLLKGSGAEADAAVGGCTAADRSVHRPLVELALRRHRTAIVDSLGCKPCFATWPCDGETLTLYG